MVQSIRKKSGIAGSPQSVFTGSAPSGSNWSAAYAAKFHMTQTQLAETAGINRYAVHKASRLATPKVQNRLTELMEIIHRVTEWAGSEQQAMAWYRSEPIPAFGGQTAEGIVKAGRAGALRDYLDHIATGGFA